MVMVKKNIKFPLEMKNGEKVRTLEELKVNYDIESILNYYFSGKLKVWYKCYDVHVQTCSPKNVHF